jgi:hypothetical protein
MFSVIRLTFQQVRKQVWINYRLTGGKSRSALRIPDGGDGPGATTPGCPCPPMLAAELWLRAGQDEAERMVVGVEVDAESSAGLHRMLSGADRQGRRLAGIEVVDLEVKMLLLRVLLARPLGGVVAIDALEAQRGPRVTRQRDPFIVGGALVDRPAGDGGVEHGEVSRAWAVDRGPGEACESGHGPTMARRPPARARSRTARRTQSAFSDPARRPRRPLAPAQPADPLPARGCGLDRRIHRPVSTTETAEEEAGDNEVARTRRSFGAHILPDRANDRIRTFKLAPNDSPMRTHGTFMGGAVMRTA